MPTRISRYVFFELLPPFAVSLLFFTFVFIMAQLLKIINLIVNYHAGLGVVSLLILYALPQFLMYILPMAAMMAVLLTLIRMSGDSEIVALKAGGVSVGRLVPPALLFCLLVSVATVAMSLYGTPWSKGAVKELTYRLAVSSFDAALKQRSFIGHFEGLTLYISEVDVRNRQLADVFIEDGRNPEVVITIAAPEGKIFRDPDSSMVRLRLYNGNIHQTNLAERSANAIRFQTYDLTLDLQEMAGPLKERKKASEMYLGELLEHLRSFEKKEKKYYKALNKLHSRFSVPAASLALGLIAIPLGLQMRTRKRSAGLGAGIAVFLIYYVLMTLGLVLGEEGYLDPAIGLWLPNVLAAAVGLLLLHRTVKELPIPGTELAVCLFDRVRSAVYRLGRRPGAEMPPNCRV